MANKKSQAAVEPTVSLSEMLAAQQAELDDITKRAEAIKAAQDALVDEACAPFRAPRDAEMARHEKVMAELKSMVDAEVAKHVAAALAIVEKAEKAGIPEAVLNMDIAAKLAAAAPKRGRKPGTSSGTTPKTTDIPAGWVALFQAPLRTNPENTVFLQVKAVEGTHGVGTEFLVRRLASAQEYDATISDEVYTHSSLLENPDGSVVNNVTLVANRPGWMTDADFRYLAVHASGAKGFDGYKPSNPGNVALNGNVIGTVEAPKAEAVETESV